MKKSFYLLVVFSLLFTAFNVKGQTCLLKRDSIIAGARATTFSNYEYDVLNRLAFVYHTDSSSSVVTNQDNVLYDGNGNVSQVESYYTVGTPVLNKTIQYVYSSGRISRVNTSGDNGAPWTMSHDVSYSGNDIQKIILDASSVTGNPSGLQGSFIDMVWSGGNIASLSLLVGTDTIELAATCDNKNNIFANFPNTEGASYLFQSKNVNNILNVQTVNNETFMGGIPQGTKVLDNSYTYDSNNNVSTLHEGQSPFNDQERTTQYTFDCSSGIHAPQTATGISLYPNPAGSVISIENGSFKGIVKIFDVAGKEVIRQEIPTERTTLDISSLKPGMYYIEMTEGNKISKGKISKN